MFSLNRVYRQKQILWLFTYTFWWVGGVFVVSVLVGGCICWYAIGQRRANSVYSSELVGLISCRVIFDAWAQRHLPLVRTLNYDFRWRRAAWNDSPKEFRAPAVGYPWSFWVHVVSRWQHPASLERNVRGNRVPSVGENRWAFDSVTLCTRRRGLENVSQEYINFFPNK